MTTQKFDERPYLKLEEASEQWGIPVTVLNQAIYEGTLQVFRPGPRSVRVHPNQLEKVYGPPQR